MKVNLIITGILLSVKCYGLEFEKILPEAGSKNEITIYFIYFIVLWIGSCFIFRPRNRRAKKC